MGPDDTVTIATPGAGGTEIPWDFIESGAPADEDVPITPRVTGRLLFKGVVVVKNHDVTNPSNVTLQIELDGVTISGGLVQKTVGPNELAAIPFETHSAVLPLGVTTQVSVILASSIADEVELNVDGSTIEIDEVQTATS
jgi:hypothetical protein